MIFGEMTKISKGVYKISLIRKDTGEVAKCLSVGNVTFFLNKEGTDSSIKPGRHLPNCTNNKRNCYCKL